jgi:hypothetical protein
MNDQGTGIGIQGDRTGIAPSGDAFAHNDFCNFPFLGSPEDSEQSMA